MKISSPAFEHDGPIPAKYTCDGENINPPLVFSDIPESAETLALVMEDPDVPQSVREDGMWDHWVLWNIDPKTGEIKENSLPEAAVGLNTGGKAAYGGPCPPDREHRYFFYLYAVDGEVDLAPGSTKKELMAVIHDRIIEQAVLIGRYAKM